MSIDETPAVVSTEWLAARLDDPALRLADVRWYLPHLGKRGRDEYERGHLPGAVFVDLETELAAPHGRGPGRHPLPAPEAFGAAMARAGVGPETHVVAYDDTGGSIAARLWWLLRHFGHPRVSVLDGGITRWVGRGAPSQQGRPGALPGGVRAPPGGGAGGGEGRGAAPERGSGGGGAGRPGNGALRGAGGAGRSPRGARPRRRQRPVRRESGAGRGGRGRGGEVQGAGGAAGAVRRAGGDAGSGRWSSTAAAESPPATICSPCTWPESATPGSTRAPGATGRPIPRSRWRPGPTPGNPWSG